MKRVLVAMRDWLLDPSARHLLALDAELPVVDNPDAFDGHYALELVAFDPIRHETIHTPLNDAEAAAYRVAETEARSAFAEDFARAELKVREQHELMARARAQREEDLRKQQETQARQRAIARERRSELMRREKHARMLASQSYGCLDELEEPADGDVVDYEDSVTATYDVYDYVNRRAAPVDYRMRAIRRGEC